MRFNTIATDKKRFLNLLLLADEQESMIDRYLERGTMYTITDGDIKAVCVVTDEGGGVLEIKNLAVSPDSQRKGYGRAMIEFLKSTYHNRFSTLQVGTGDSPLTLPFYVKCGFRPAFRIKNFFTEHYDHPIIEAGVQLKDMVYLQIEL